MAGVETTFRDIEPYEKAVREVIEGRAAELEKIHSGMLNCRIVVDAPHRHKNKGGHYNVKVELYMPDKNIVVSNEHPLHKAHEDIFVAVRDVFDAARRQLEDYVRERHGVVKTHEPAPHGRIIKLFADYGFIETPDGREIYFHQNSVLDGKFKSLNIGGEVRFSEEMGDKGPQASTVKPIGKHHIAEHAEHRP